MPEWWWGGGVKDKGTCPLKVDLLFLLPYRMRGEGKRSKNYAIFYYCLKDLIGGGEEELVEGNIHIYVVLFL